MRALVFIFCVLLLSCSNNNSGPIRYDGIYQTKKLENQNTGDTYRYFLKFYEDGTVINVTSSGTASEIKKWFKKGHENSREGEYEIDGDEITIGISSDYGDTEYTGTIKDRETLSLKSIGDNGNKERLTFYFVEN